MVLHIWYAVIIVLAMCWCGAARCPRSCNCTIKSRVECIKKAALTSVPLDMSSTLGRLVVKSNEGITSLPNDLSKRYRHLKRVEVMQCSLDQVNSLVFAQARRLEYLDLSENRLTSLHRDWQNGSSSTLRELVLRSNQLTDIRWAVRGFKQLKRLFMSHNRIQRLEQGCFQGLGELVDLELNGNRISSIASQAFLPLKKLTSLVANGNPRLPEELHLKVGTSGLV